MQFNKNFSMKKNHSGFTLVELSITLVIIALIVGGVLAGQSIILSAKNMKGVQSINQLQTSVNAFKLRYNCLPGDCANAANYFPGAISGSGGGVIDGIYDVPTPPADSTFQNCSGLACVVFSFNTEVFSFNDHLARAGLLKLAPFDRTDTVTNLRPNVGWPTTISESIGLFGFSFNGENYIKVGGNSQWGPGVGTTVSLNQGYMTPFTARFIDEKIDDGSPRGGLIHNMTELSFPYTYTWTFTCSSATEYLNATDISSQCGLFIRNAF